MRSLLAAALLLTVAVAMTACGGASTGAPLPSARPTPDERGVLITRADDRGTVRARVGERVQIALGTEFEWRLDQPDGTVLRADAQNRPLPRGTQATWSAAAAGTATVTATGTVICPSGRACIQLAVLFTATVVVVDP